MSVGNTDNAMPVRSSEMGKHVAVVRRPGSASTRRIRCGTQGQPRRGCGGCSEFGKITELASYTVGAPRPPRSAAATASSSPGHGGVVWHRNRSCPSGPRSELEAPPRRYHQRIARRHLLRRHRCGLGIRRAAPDPTLALQDVPGLLDSPVVHWPRHLPRRQRHLHHAALAGPMSPVRQQSYLRPVGSVDVRLLRPPRQWEQCSMHRSASRFGCDVVLFHSRPLTQSGPQPPAEMVSPSPMAPQYGTAKANSTATATSVMITPVHSTSGAVISARW